MAQIQWESGTTKSVEMKQSHYSHHSGDCSEKEDI